MHDQWVASGYSVSIYVCVCLLYPFWLTQPFWVTPRDCIIGAFLLFLAGPCHWISTGPSLIKSLRYTFNISSIAISRVSANLRLLVTLKSRHSNGAQRHLGSRSPISPIRFQSFMKTTTTTNWHHKSLMEARVRRMTSRRRRRLLLEAVVLRPHRPTDSRRILQQQQQQQANPAIHSTLRGFHSTTRSCILNNNGLTWCTRFIDRPLSHRNILTTRLRCSRNDGLGHRLLRPKQKTGSMTTTNITCAGHRHHRLHPSKAQRLSATIIIRPKRRLVTTLQKWTFRPRSWYPTRATWAWLCSPNSGWTIQAWCSWACRSSCASGASNLKPLRSSHTLKAWTVFVYPCLSRRRRSQGTVADLKGKGTKKKGWRLTLGWCPHPLKVTQRRPYRIHCGR